MNKQKLSERDICTKFITPALVAAGWDVQLHIREEIFFTKGRVIVRGRMTADVKVNRSVLLRCVQFFRALPIVATWRQLSWAHFRELIPVADPKQRRALATEANRNGWPVARLVERIRELALAEEVLAV